MSSFYKFVHAATSSLVLFSLTLSALPVPSASAQDQEDGIVRDYNAETGKVSMISGVDDEPITILSAMSTGMTDEDRADALVQSFAPEFGITDPAGDLQVMEQSQADENRVVTRYQQTYNDIPVMAGELIVNASEQGALYSMNGEVAQGLSLDTTPTLSAEEAVTVARQGMVKWYKGQASDYAPSAEAELWIFDESLLKESIRPAMLVWRMEMIPADGSPIRELVLVDAKTGNIPMHFNQIDTSGHKDETTPTPTEEPTEEPVEEYPTTPTPQYQPTEEPDDLNAQATIYYVDIVNGNDGNTCTSAASPCKNIKQAIEKGNGNNLGGDTIYVASGTYTWTNSSLAARLNWGNIIITDRGITLSGGWNTAFNTQNGVSIIDGQNNRQCILANSGTTVVENFIIQNCLQGDGAGIYAVNGIFTLRNSTVKNNTGDHYGAGFYISNTNFTMINSTVSGNGNSSTDNGGGIYILGTSVVNIQNSTIAYNTAQNGGGIQRIAGTLNVTNSIIANNTATVSGADCNGTIANANYNIIENISGCSITAGGNNLNVDPQIDSGLTGMMQLHVLQAGSPAINAGTSTGCPATDQAGTLRPQGAMCDIGAYEFAAVGLPDVIEVSSGSSQGAQPLANFTNSLTAIVKDENGFPISGETVTFTAPGSGASGIFADTSNNITTAVTNASGMATASVFTANSTVGSYTVEATIPSLALPAEFTLENYISAVTNIGVNAGSPQSSVYNTAYGSLMKVLVTDQYLKPLSGVSVTFTAPVNGASGTFTDTSTNVTTAVTNASGIATASAFTANASGGSFVVEATVIGIPTPAQFQMQNFTHIPTTLSVSSGSIQTTLLNTAFGYTLKALVKDENNDPQAGVMVTFTAPSSGASGYFSNTSTYSTTAITDVNGIATASTLTANNISGTYNVNASVSGIASPAVFQLTNILAGGPSIVKYEDLVVDSARNRLYGSDKTGNKVDVIDMTSMSVINTFALGTGAAPVGLDLSPNGNELAIAQSGLTKVKFIDLTNGTISEMPASLSTSGNKPFDVIYGRSGVLYALSTRAIHVIDLTATPHSELTSQYVLVSSIHNDRFGALSSDKNTLYLVAGNSGSSANEMLFKYDVSAGLTQPTLITSNTISGTTYSGNLRLSMINDGSVLVSSGDLYNTSNLIPKSRYATNITPVLALPGKGFYVSLYNNASGADLLYFHDVVSSYQLSSLSTGVAGTPGAITATADGNTLFVSSTGGMAKFTINSTPSGTSVALPVSTHQYKDIAIDLSRARVYGTDSSGRIDVYNLNTTTLIDSYLLPAGALPKGIALSPDGSELAIALSGLEKILFINPETGNSIAEVSPTGIDSAKPFDVIYGRIGRLYANGSPGSGGSDYLHIIDTVTHTWLDRSDHPALLRTGAELAITSDNKYIYANQTFSPNQLYAFDVQNDPTGTWGWLYQGPHGPVNALHFTIAPDGSKVFTSNGQVWDGILTSQLSSFSGTPDTDGIIKYINGAQKTVAVKFNDGSGDIIKFFSAVNYDLLQTMTFPGEDIYEMEVSADSSKLVVNTTSGIKVINVNPAIPNTIDIFSGNNQSVKPQNQFSQPFVVELKNYLGQPVAGVTVTFTAPATGATGTFVDTNTNTTSILTNANGRAISPMFVANNVTGGYLLSASVTSLPISVNFHLTNGIQVTTYSANNGTVLPGEFRCDLSAPICNNGSGILDTHANKAQQFAFGIYNFYLINFGRNSIDNNDMAIISTVHYDSSYDNAFWNGDQMVFGDGSHMPVADDIVAHEFTHGVTDYGSDLFYFYQSGAINESFSDLWGEYYDQSNGIGSDDPSDKWLIGEDTYSNGNGAFRSMSDPTLFDDPDTMTSTLYNLTDEDNGGVHYNSGINNKAVFLMVDGGTFNGYTINGIGWAKTAAIYYEVQTNLLSSGSDYSDLYYAVQQSCTTLSLANFKGITSTNCIEVKKALDAVQMNSQPVANFNVDALVCPAGQSTAPAFNLFSDDFETGINKWVLNNSWSLEDFYAASPSHMMFGTDYISSATSTLKMNNAVILPAGTSYLYFKHAFGFEFDEDGYYDGGVLEYSTDNGNTWVDAKLLYSSGQNYKGRILTAEGSDSTLQGRSGFVGDSHGYVSTRYNLTSLAGKAVLFRWVISTDQFFSYFGWVVDDVKIYTCMGSPSVPTYVAPASNGLVTDYTPLLDWSDATPNINHYQIQVATNNTFTSPIHDVNNLLTSEYVVPSDLNSNTTYYWRVRAFNTINETKGWTATRTFRTALTPPALTSVTLPLANNRPALDWTDVVDTTNYTLQISTVNTFASFVLNTTVNGSSYVPIVDLPANKTLYWRVSANGTNGPSAWSAPSSFSTANPPSVPALSAPTDKSLSTDLTPKLDWANSTSPLLVFFDHYQVQIATDAAFSNLVDDYNTLGGSSNSEYTPTSDLSANTTYYWRVRSFESGSAYSAWSLTRSFRTALSAPTITPVTVENNRPAFDWTDVPGATGYTIQISTVNTFASFVSKVTVTSSTYTPAVDLPANKTLYWRVLANGTNGPSLPSASSSFVTLNPPSIPTLSAPVDNLLVTSGSLLPPKLDWANATVPAGVTFNGYQLQVATDAAFTAIVLDQNIPGLPSASEFTLSAPLVQNTKYFWRVRSYGNTNHNSSWSLTRSFRIAMPAPAALAAPANAATSQLNRPVFDWDDVPGATGYTLQVSTVNTFASFALNTSASSSTFVPSVDLPANKTLYWRVIANGPNGPSLPSAFSSFSTANPPSVPTLAAPTDNLLISNTLLPKLDWNNSTVPVGVTLTGYEFQMATDAGFTSLLPESGAVSSSEFTFTTPLTQNTKYYWRVRSLNSTSHPSSWSTTRSFRIALPAGTLASPSGALLTNLPTFDWNDVPGATGYTVQVSLLNTFTSFVLNTSSTNSVFTPTTALPANKTLFWRVIANGPNGPSLPSASLSFTTGNPPSVPTLAAPVDNVLITNTLLPKLDWNNSTIPAGTTFDHYEVQWATDAAFSTGLGSQNVNGISNSEFTFASALSQNTKYFWHVRSVNSAGQYSGWSLTRSFRLVMPAPTLTSPTGTISANPPTFDWDDVAGATYYSIQISTSNTFATTLVNTTAPTSTFTPTTPLPANTALYWRVLAQGPNGPSSWSSFSTFVIQ